METATGQASLSEEVRIGMDVDKDGFVTLREMRDYREEKKREAENAIPNGFKKVDANGDGKISKEEAETKDTTGRALLSEEQRVRMDVDKDEFVTLQEWRDDRDKAKQERAQKKAEELTERG